MFNEFREKLQKLTYLEFEGHDRLDGINLGLTEQELMAELAKAPANDLFLGFYTEAEIREHLERYGIIGRLAELGYPDVQIEIRTQEVFSHRLYIYTEQRDYDHMLVELRLREGWFRPKEQFVDGIEIGPMPMILVDWLMLQNPQRKFDDERPALPEQRYPGLGLLASLIPLVGEVVKETGRKGVLDVPEHYHGALFYSRWFRFYNPEMEGKLLAIKRDLGSLSLHDVSHGFDLDCIINTKTGKYEKWIPGEQIMPIGDDLVAYYAHSGYGEIRDRTLAEKSYELDRGRFERRIKERDAESAGAPERRPAAERS